MLTLPNQALNNTPVADDLFRKTLRILQSICSSYQVLPSSCLVPSERLSRGETIGDGSPVNPYEAELDGERVFIKTVKSDAQDPGAVMNNVCLFAIYHWQPTLRHPDRRLFSEESLCGGGCNTLTSSPSSGYQARYRSLSRLLAV